MKIKTAVITGVLGQDGSYLAEYLLSLGYKVVGIYKRVSTGTIFKNVEAIINHPQFELIEGSITDPAFMMELISNLKPDELYNLAALSHVGMSFKVPMDTFRVDAEAVILQLDIIRNFSPKTKFYQASTSEMFGGLNCPKEGFDEHSILTPRSPYAIAKVAAHHSIGNYRTSYGLFACSGILFNHSSPRRGTDFATRKITQGVANIVKGKQKTLKMGNMESFRDEGHAKDYVKAMHLMLQQDKADDYVVSTGEGATIKEMLEHVCSIANLKYESVYEMNEAFMRPSDVPYLLGNSAKIRNLGWKPEFDWRALLKEMYESDLQGSDLCLPRTK